MTVRLVPLCTARVAADKEHQPTASHPGRRSTNMEHAETHRGPVGDESRFVQVFGLPLENGSGTPPRR